MCILKVNMTFRMHIFIYIFLFADKNGKFVNFGIKYFLKYKYIASDDK